MKAKRAAQTATTALGVVGTAMVARRAWRSPAAWLIRMSGTTISTPDAAGWVTDFLNAAYYARTPELRDVEDLRIATAILTTRWHRKGHHRLHATDVAAFHRAFFRERILDASHSPRGTLDRDQLFAGANRLFGASFQEAYLDDARRGHGIAFEDESDLQSYRPEFRLRHAKLGEPTPPQNQLSEQVWHTYDPVAVPSAERVIAGLARPETWPDYASDLGRFTAVRSGGLPGQAFEIEIITPLTPRTPTLLRGYVTATRVVGLDDADPIGPYAEEINDLMVRVGRDQPPPFPLGCTALLAIELTTHEGHFMGRGRNRLLLFEQKGQAYLRAAGSWDDMPISLETAYRTAGRHAQQAFWGDEHPNSSMLHQIALRAADR
ncbi:MAG: hypothetical protein QOG15_2449 [Solirubrobacteraceae bacterium]|jgi:hypothetical protein|nr:hypothetical protein [Solirubrobacteraceae bacterium]